MNLCKYSDLFGEPGKGAHTYRIFDIAIIDVLLTILGAFAISKYYNFNFGKTVLSLFLFGIIAHRLFCVRTTVDKLLFK